VPFTPSHAAAALLFTRTPLLPAALVAGSVAPDLPYYLPVPVDRELTHEPLGVITADLVIALVAFLAWQLVFRTPVLDLAPGWLRTRMPERPSGRWWPASQAPVVTAGLLLISLVVGSVTHLAWDEFTHPGWLVDQVPFLQAQAGPLVVHKWLQHASSVIGLTALGIFAARWVRRTPSGAEPAIVTDRARRAAWIGIAAVFLVAACAGWALALFLRHEQGLPFALLDPGVVFQTARICVGAALAAAVLVCLGWYGYRSRALNNTRDSAGRLPRKS